MLNPMRWLQDRQDAAQRGSTCPRCLTVGKLVIDEGQSTLAGERMVRCTHVFDDCPYDAVCDFVIPESVLSLPRLNISTLGMADVGETHWTAMVLWLLETGQCPSNSLSGRFLESEWRARWNYIIKGIIDDRMNPPATTIPDRQNPLLYHVQQLSGRRVELLLVLAIPCVGSKGTMSNTDDPLRLRQLAADGIVFFVDPTRPTESQRYALQRFAADFRVIGRNDRFRSNRKIPIAVCVTKCDLLSHVIKDTTDLFALYSDLSRIGQETKLFSAAQIEARSRWTRTLWSSIWPEWKVDADLVDLCGDQFEFFPVSNVGLTEIGEHDLSKRTIQPYGVLEPLLWLLNANGHRIW